MLDRGQVKSLEPVSIFLKSKERRSGSTNTSRSYLTALVHFNTFLSPQHTAGTILRSLIKGERNVYELLDSFAAGYRRFG